MRHSTIRNRQRFDAILRRVIAGLPQPLADLLHAVPVCVDDRPSPELLAEMDLAGDDQLLGLYVGTPLTERETDAVGEPSEMIYLFRDTLLDDAASADGGIDERHLSEQIRITLLHELGHHYGLEEDRLDELGYG